MKIEAVSFVFGASKQKKKSNKQKAAIAVGASVVLAAGATTALVLAGRKKPDKYLVDLAQGLSKELNRTVKPSDLEAVMTKEEFLREIPKLKDKNFIASAENIKNGTFQADLHSHSNFSDGRISVKDLMEQAANYGDTLNQINGKKFIFALSDHDGVNGVIEALKLIAENPNKYKNVKFIPAAELSFIETCSKGSKRYEKYQSDVQMPEMLIYNINPFSENTKEFFSNLYAKRELQVKNMIAKANAESVGYNFSLEEYKRFVDKSQGKYYLLNQHWNIHNYLQLKTRLVDIAREQKRNEKEFFEETIIALADAKRSPNGLSRYLQEKNIQTTTPEIYDRITRIATEFFPKNKDGYAVSDYENTFDNIADFAIRERAHLALAHPGFTMQNFTEEECFEKMRSYIIRSRGTLRFSEKYHQAYPFGDSIQYKELAQYYKILDRFNLLNFGGRDNHSDKFI